MKINISSVGKTCYLVIFTGIKTERMESGRHGDKSEAGRGPKVGSLSHENGKKYWGRREGSKVVRFPGLAEF